MHEGKPEKSVNCPGKQAEHAASILVRASCAVDALPARPGGHPKGSYCTRGSGHDKYGRYTEDSDAYVEVVDRLLKKVESAADSVPAPEVRGEGAPYGMISIGGCHWAVLEARDDLAV